MSVLLRTIANSIPPSACFWRYCRFSRFVQHGLKPVDLRGAISVDPRKEDFFTRVIEYRKQNKADDRLQYFLKILANSTSYGTYLELNPVKIDPSNRPKITVYSGEHMKE